MPEVLDTHEQDQRLAYALLRIAVGVNLMMHGISRILTGNGEFAAKLVMQFEHAPLPAWSVWAFGLILPYVEGTLGVLLLIGLKTRTTLIAATLLIILLTFGSTLLQDWSAAGIQLTYAAIYAALLFLRRHNRWSADSWIARQS